MRVFFLFMSEEERGWGWAALPYHSSFYLAVKIYRPVTRVTVNLLHDRVSRSCHLIIISANGISSADGSKLIHTKWKDAWDGSERDASKIINTAIVICFRFRYDCWVIAIYVVQHVRCGVLMQHGATLATPRRGKMIVSQGSNVLMLAHGGKFCLQFYRPQNALENRQSLLI